MSSQESYVTHGKFWRHVIKQIATTTLFVLSFQLGTQVFAQSWSTSPTVNNAISTAVRDQRVPTITTDGAGGAIITWQDWGNGFNYVQRIDAAGVIQWTPGGVPVSTASGNQGTASITSDGAGGAYLTWADGRNPGFNNGDIYAQHFDSNGSIYPGLWVANGIPIATAPDRLQTPTITGDGSGGALITWEDITNAPSGRIYAQRINAAGMVQWLPTATGVQVSSSGGIPAIVNDGAGGAIIAWSGHGIRAQRINGAGVVQWTPTATGVPLAPLQANATTFPGITSDGEGGAIVTWGENISGNARIHAQRINQGGVVKWGASGVALTTVPTAGQFEPTIVSDRAGGAIIAWVDDRGDPTTDGIYAQRVDGSGAIQWTGNGAAISTSPPLATHWHISSVSDGAGGAIITWEDDRNNVQGLFDIYAQRINAAGVVQWTIDGVAISTAPNTKLLNGSSIDPTLRPNIVSNSEGCAIITWYDGRNGVDFDIYAQQVNGSGNLGPCTSCVTPPSDMVAWWPFDETSGTTAHDIRGFVDNLGMHVNGPSPSLGEVGGAVCLDGVNDHIAVANQSEVNFPSNCPSGNDGPFTIDLWVKTSVNRGVSTILDKRVNSNQPVGNALFLLDGRLGFQLADGSVPGSSCGTSPAFFPCTNYGAPGPPSPDFVDVASGDWHFIAVTVTRCPVAVGKMYVDGKLVLTFTPRTGNIDNSADLQIGRRDPSFGETHFEGCIDELEFFKRELTDNEIRAIFDAGHSGKCFRQPCPTITLNPATLVHQTWAANVDNPPLNLTATGGTGPYKFTVAGGILPTGMLLDPDGTSHGTPIKQGTFDFNVTVEDANGCLGVRQYQIVISCPTIFMNPASGGLPTSVVNTHYSQTFTATGGCSSSFTYSLTSGALPPGLMLASNGVLSGTATQLGNFTFTVTATDNCGCSLSETYTLNAQKSAPNDVKSKTLVISAFRENGPNGAGDEFVEIFNPSDTAVTVGTLPGVSINGIGVFSNDGNNAGVANNAVFLRCQIPATAVIKGKGWYLCGGSDYSLGDLGLNGGTTHSVPDTTIGTGNSVVGDIPDDAGLVLLNVGSNTVTLNSTGFFSGGSRAIVFDSVGFRPYGLGAPATGDQPSLAFMYCEGICLQPVGDASIITSLPATPSCPVAVGPISDPSAFPVQQDGFIGSVPVCYGESGQYKIGRRRSAQQFDPVEGNLHRDTDNNADDFILDAPNPASRNVGQSITGTPGVSSVLGAAGPHNSSAPPMIGSALYRESGFDVPSGPRNAERQYGLLSSIANSENNPLGVLILRRRFTNALGLAPTGARYRIDDISTLCGDQAGIGSRVATQEARNLRGPDFTALPATAPTPTCQGEGSDTGLFTAVLKAVNHYAENVVDGSNITQLVLGAILEDTSVPGAGTPAPGSHQPLGGGSNSSYVTTSVMPLPGGAADHIVGDGVNGGVGTFATSGTIRRVAFKFGVVRSGRFKLLIGPEVAVP